MKYYLEQILQRACEKAYPGCCTKSSLYRKKYADYSSAILLKISQETKQSPKDVWQRIQTELPNLEITASIELTEKGFMNFFISKTAQFDMITKKINRLTAVPKRTAAEHNLEVINYAHMRINNVLPKLVNSDDKMLVVNLTVEEEQLIECLDEILSVFYISSDAFLLKKLQHLAVNIHSYFNVITLLCDNKEKYNLQVCLLKNCFMMLEIGILTFGLRV